MTTAIAERFTQTDPLNADVTSPYPSAYVYGNNNPTVFSDPSGERGAVLGSRNPIVPEVLAGTVTKCKVCKIRGYSKSEFDSKFKSWLTSADGKSALAASSSSVLSSSQSVTVALGGKAWTGYQALDAAVQCFGNGHDDDCLNGVVNASSIFSSSPIGLAPAIGFMINFNVGVVTSTLGSLRNIDAALNEARVLKSFPGGSQLFSSEKGSLWVTTKVGGVGKFLRDCGDIQ
jgi:hypothetical protein